MQDFDRYDNQSYNAFFDHGSWHGFLLPNSVEQRGSFTGPLIVAEEYALFLASALDNVEIIDARTNKTYDKSQAAWTYAERDGALLQSLRWPDLELQLRLRFSSAHTALIETSLRNLAGHPQSLQLVWRGELLANWQTAATAQAEKQAFFSKVADKFPDWQRSLTADSNGIQVQFGRLRSATDAMFSGTSRYWITRTLKSSSVLMACVTKVAAI